MLRHTSIVDSQKLVGSSSHVNEVMFSFGAFLVHELENGIMIRRLVGLIRVMKDKSIVIYLKGGLSVTEVVE